MGKLYLEQVLKQLADKANVVIQTKETEAANTYCLGNHYAARWLVVLEEKFTYGYFEVLSLEKRVSGSDLTWVITIDHARDRTTDRLEQLSNCIIPVLDY